MFSVPSPQDVRVEHFPADVLGIGTVTPRLSWRYAAEIPQGACAQIRVERFKPRHGSDEQTAIVDAGANVMCDWPFEPLDSREQVHASVRLVSQDGEPLSEWSPRRFFDVGLMSPHQRVADFVGPSWPEFETDHRHQPLVRTEFELRGEPRIARLYLTALGLVEAEINGRRVGDDVLNPGWTSYDNRVLCWTYDVLDLVHEGRNALGCWLADGWYRGRVGFDGGEANVWGERIGVFAQLEVTYADGSRQSLYSNSSDERWRTTLGPIVRSNMYEGETYDARLEMPGWSEVGFDDSDWRPVAEVKFDEHRIEFPAMEAIRADGTQPVRSIERRPDVDGRPCWIVDMGQNASQRIRLHMRGLRPGETVVIGHAEVLDPDGDLGTRPLKRGRQVDTYISNGSDAWWEPRFDMHGFRYARIVGIEDLTADDIVCTVYHSAMRRTGWFETSNELVNRLHENTLWSMRSNFMSIPTDCPQRDERVGWTADIAVFAPTAMYLYDVAGFLSNWLEDVSFEQLKNGTVPFYIPYVRLGIWADPAAIAVWGDAAVLVPWSVYMASGDRGVLADNYGLATRWVDEVTGYLSEDGVWDRRPDYPIGQLGDWLDPNAPADSPDQAMTAKELVATAFHVHSLRLVARMGDILGRRDEAEEYRRRAGHVAEGFRNRFIGAGGLMTSDTQCAYTLAIVFDLVDEETKQRFGNRLAQLVRESEGRIGTGFAGTAYILPALTATGHYDEAYGLFLSTKCPSWLYQVTMGATTIWERWDSLLPNGEMNPGSMTSFNHYALGSVNDWAHAVIGGIAPMEPGWRTIRIAPHPGGGLTHASARHDTPYGRVGCDWRIEDGTMQVSLTVPYGSTAVVSLPGCDEEHLSGGVYQRMVALPAA